MRTVACLALRRDVSALGFGCADLGSRTSASQAGRLLEAAFERGVTWFDVAPMDGHGAAEAILGRFIASRRADVVVAARVGRVEAPAMPLRRFLSTLKRGVLGAFSELRAAGADAFGTRREPLRAERVEADTLETLRRLQTAYVDVLLLDYPTPRECADPAILEALKGVVASGRARSLGVCGAPEAIGAARATGVFKVLQVHSDPFRPAIARLRGDHARDDEFLVLKGPLASAHDRLTQLLVGDGGRLASLASQLAYGPPFMASEILLDYALGDNPEGVVVAVMSQASHVERNCARAARPPRADTVDFVDKIVLTSPAARAMLKGFHGRH